MIKVQWQGALSYYNTTNSCLGFILVVLCLLSVAIYTDSLSSFEHFIIHDSVLVPASKEHYFFRSGSNDVDIDFSPGKSHDFQRLVSRHRSTFHSFSYWCSKLYPSCCESKTSQVAFRFFICPSNISGGTNFSTFRILPMSCRVWKRIIRRHYKFVLKGKSHSLWFGVFHQVPRKYIMNARYWSCW